jgi:uncharacterized protein YjbI with pentapeptide repeats
MPLDFSGRNLRGQNFRGQDLSGANFSNADIRGANFTNASLRGANFTGARAGIQRRWLLILTITSWFLAGISAFSLGFAANLALYLFAPSIIQNITIIPGLSALAILVTFLFGVYRKGYGIALILAVIAIAVAGIVTSAFAGAVAASASYIIAGTLIFAIAGIVAITAAVAMTIAVSGKIAGFIAIFIIAILSTTTALSTVVAVAGGSGTFGIILVVVLTLVSCYRGWHTLADEKYAFIRAIAIGWAAIGGTSFRNADLTCADFTKATLKSSDFRNARLNSVNWRAAKKLDQARVGNSVLSNPAIRALLVTKNGYKQSYTGADLHGVNLQDAYLVEANLKRADLSGAVFQNANLSRSNLTEVLATGTVFTKAMLTGACIQSWNISHTTKLDDIDCQFVFLLENPNELGSCERRPSDPNTFFNHGEFTKLFEGALDTVDIIFRKGLDSKAFVEAFRTIKVESGVTELSIQNIEKREDGDVLLQFFVSREVDKSEITRQFLENYQLAIQDIEAKYITELQAKDREVEIYQKESKELREILKTIAGQSIVSIVIDSEQQDAEK